VEIFQEPTRHTVDVPKLLKWIRDERLSNNAADDMRREKVRNLLGEHRR
jgi:hypothetical protein